MEKWNAKKHIILINELTDEILKKALFFIGAKQMSGAVLHKMRGLMNCFIR
jgi:hypothetical protein